jgi:hypothetical protein
MSKAIKAFALAMIIAAPASVAFAQSPPPYGGGYGPYPVAPRGYYYPQYLAAPYGYANPSVTTPYGTYPAYTYDPDPRLSAQLRSDFNRGVDTPGR